MRFPTNIDTRPKKVDNHPELVDSLDSTILQLQSRHIYV